MSYRRGLTGAWKMSPGRPMSEPCVRCNGSGKEPPLPIEDREHLSIIVDRIVQDYCTSGHVDAPGMLARVMAAITEPAQGTLL